ncbi:unnamed protein product, partial [Bubo scandiacus]
MPSCARSVNICLGKDFKSGDVPTAVTASPSLPQDSSPGSWMCARIGPTHADPEGQPSSSVPGGGCAPRARSSWVGKPVQVQRGGLQWSIRRDEKYHAVTWRLCFSTRAMQQQSNAMEVAWSRETMWNNAGA